MTQLVLPLETQNALGREDFIVAPGNIQAVGFIDSYPAWPAAQAALYGPRACGKTHLAQAWATRAGAHILDALALDLDIPDGPLVIEDVRAGVCESALFALFERGTAVLLTAASAPKEWSFELPDLASRTRALLSFQLGAPDESLLMGLAVKLFADRQLVVPEAVVRYMIQSLERSPGAIRDFIAQADGRALAEKRPVNISLIKALLESSAAS